MFSRGNCQTVCKPGSVPPIGQAVGRGWPFIWDVRCRTPRATDPSGGAEGPPGGAGRSRRRLPLLLGLAPGGVYPAATVAGGAVRSYRTISPLPPAVPKGGTGLAVCFCGTFPGVAPAGRYPAPCLRGARTFLPPPWRLTGAKSGHPTVWLGSFGTPHYFCQTRIAEPAIGHGAVCRTSAIKRRTAGALSPRRHARFNGAISPALRASGR